MNEREDHLLHGTVTRSILDSFRDVHNALGFGYREYIYALGLERDLIAKGHQVDREVAVMVYYRGEPLARQTIDMIVDRRVIVENKATERLHPSASEQLLSYLCSTNFRGRTASPFRTQGKLSTYDLRKPIEAPRQVASGDCVSQSRLCPRALPRLCPRSLVHTRTTRV